MARAIAPPLLAFGLSLALSAAALAQQAVGNVDFLDNQGKHRREWAAATRAELGQCRA